MVPDQLLQIKQCSLAHVSYTIALVNAFIAPKFKITDNFFKSRDTLDIQASSVTLTGSGDANQRKAYCNFLILT